MNAAQPLPITLLVGVAYAVTVQITSAEICTVVLADQPSEACTLQATSEHDTAFKILSAAMPAALTAGVDAQLSRLQGPSVAAQGRAVVERLRLAMAAFDLADLPPWRGTEHDDGSFSIEWRFPDRRLAFTIERDPAESGWHLVSSRSSDGVLAYGGLPGPSQDLRPLLSWALARMPSA